MEQLGAISPTLLWGHRLPVTALATSQRLNNRAVRGGILPGGHQVVPVDGLQAASHGVRYGRREPSFWQGARENVLLLHHLVLDGDQLLFTCKEEIMTNKLEFFETSLYHTGEILTEVNEDTYLCQSVKLLCRLSFFHWLSEDDIFCPDPKAFFSSFVWY